MDFSKHHTAREIVTQSGPLRQSLNALAEKTGDLRSLWSARKPKRVVTTGAGSSFCLAESAALMIEAHLGVPATALAAGDLMLHTPLYRRLLEDALIVAPSRSGQTSELILAIERARPFGVSAVVALNGVEGSPLSQLADFTLDLPWLPGESVCQTHAVTCLYGALAGICATWAGKDHFLEELQDPRFHPTEAFIRATAERLTPVLEERPWEHAFILADGAVWGLASEGAMAIREMSLTHASAYRLLDFRHGPMALVNASALVILLASGNERNYQRDLVADIRHHGARVVVAQGGPQEDWSADCLIELPQAQFPETHGLRFITLSQLCGYRQAVRRGLNPDAPPQISAWVQL